MNASGDAARDPERPILLFDGVCNLCNAWVTFVLRREREARLRFASLQSRTGRALVERFGLDPDALDSVVLIEDGAAHVRTAAVLRVVRRLKAPWCWLGAVRICPRPVRDLAYRLVARGRYRVFGRRDSCPAPRPEHQARFLEDDAAPAGPTPAA